MEDFDKFVSSKKESDKKGETPSDLSKKSLPELIAYITKKYNGASGEDLMRAIVKEAEEGKKNGTLSNDDIDRFSRVLSPFLDSKKKAFLKKVVEDLKKI